MPEDQATELAAGGAAPVPQQQLPALRSYLLAKRGRAQFEPSRVKLEAAQLLPKLRHSQGGIGFYGRVRERAASRSVELWSHQKTSGQPSLALGPSTELTGHYHSETPVSAKKIVANSNCGQYPFSQIVYSNLIGQGDRPIGAADPSRSGYHSSAIGDYSAHRPQRSQGAFVLRHKLRQSSSCLSRILEGPPNACELGVRRAMSQVK